jgi:hypothetical protein
MEQAEAAEERDDAKCDQSGSQLDRLELHSCQLNKKTRATQGCSGFEKCRNSYGCAETKDPIPIPPPPAVVPVTGETK